MATFTPGKVYKSKSYKHSNNSISYMAWVVATTFMITTAGFIILGWGLAIEFNWIKAPKIPWSSLEIGCLAFLYLAGSLINGYRPTHPSHTESAQRVRRQDSSHLDASQRT